MTALSSNNAHFNDAAKTWDDRPGVRELCAQAAALTATLVPLDPASTRVLDLGCGTGLLAMALAPKVHTVVGVDPSEAMVAAFRDKIAAGTRDGALPTSPNLHAVCVDVMDPAHADPACAGCLAGPGLPIAYDLIVAHMTLHHIPDIRLDALVGRLAPRGRLLAIDIQESPSSHLFHPPAARADLDMHVGGFNPDSLKALFEAAGLSQVTVHRNALSMTKAVRGEGAGEGGAGGESSQTKTFPLFALLGIKA